MEIVSDEDVGTLIDRIQSVLTPDLLKPEYHAANESNPMYGHCYVAAEVLHHLLLNRRDFRYRPCRGKDANGVVHWWLVRDDGELIDPTKEQYTSIGQEPPYDNGKFGPFLTKYPSARAALAMDRIEKKYSGQ